jgi:hypothetical protein
MKLPNGEAAIVELAKLEQYCLNPTHPHGRHKARVFRAVLGMTKADARELRTALRSAAAHEEAIPGTLDEYGARYIIDFELIRDDARAVIRSSWIVLHGQMRPRFVTCFVR